MPMLVLSDGVEEKSNLLLDLTFACFFFFSIAHSVPVGISSKTMRQLGLSNS